jgi:predicted transcriptional regulator
MIKFTTILHEKRNELDISMLEYVLLDTIEKLSKPRCRAHKKTIAEFIGLSRQGLIKAINRLTEKGLLTRINDKELAVTQRWIDETISVNKVDTGVNKVYSKCKQSLQPTNNRIKEIELKDKNKQKEIILPKFIDQSLWDDFIELRQSLKAKNTDRALNMLVKNLEQFEKEVPGSANKAISESIMNSWKGVFAPKKGPFNFRDLPSREIQGNLLYLDYANCVIYDSNGQRSYDYDLHPNGAITA